MRRFCFCSMFIAIKTVWCLLGVCLRGIALITKPYFRHGCAGLIGNPRSYTLEANLEASLCQRKFGQIWKLSPEGCIGGVALKYTIRY